MVSVKCFSDVVWFVVVVEEFVVVFWNFANYFIIWGKLDRGRVSV